MRLAAIAAAFLIAAAASAGDLLTPAEKRGREIYLHGTAGERPITAFFGADGAGEIDASIVPCASCHGADGRGVPEGTVAPSDIRWEVLGRPFASADGTRRRPRYDDALLERAVRDAVDAAGTPLFAVMPRYRMDARDLADLVAYMHRLDNEPQPGLGDTKITIATVTASPAMRDVLRGAFDDVNAQGGLFGRSLELQAVDAAALHGGIFGVIGASNDPVLDTIVAAERIPLVTPFPSSPESRSSVSSFFLFPDLESQVLALLDFAAERTAGRAIHLAVIDDGSAPARAAAEAATRRYAPTGGDPDFLLLIGNVDVAGAAAAAGNAPILIAGASLSRSLFDLRGKTIFIAAPTLPSDISDDGRRDFESFAARHHLPPEHRAAQIAAYASAKVFLEALRRSGRDVTREKVIAALERLYQFSTELTPPVTFSPNRHVGALGAYVVGVDLDRRTFLPTTRWITPAE